MANAGSRLAILDGGSFVLPYDCQLILALARRGSMVDFYGSRTRYNGELLEVLRRTTGVTVYAADVSGSVAPRWRGALAYLGLLIALWRRRDSYRVINLQFSLAWLVELPFLWAVRSRLAFTVHNAAPHGFEGEQHGPTRRIARLAKTLVFVSESTRDEFARRYGEVFRARSVVMPHGLLPIAAASPPVPYRPLDPQAPPRRALLFWGNVQPYKGVDLFGDLARAPVIRERRLSLEVHGAWAPGMNALRDDLREQGVVVNDGFLSTDALTALMSRDAVFLLPYTEASQSGALYALLAAGRVFICADVGDLGAFMRRFGLEGLLLRERSAAAVAECLDHLQAHAEHVAKAFGQAQRQHHWDALLASAEAVYGGTTPTGPGETIPPPRSPMPPA
ncbi:hypothetical protein BH11PSE8_BH11PSE8_17880 [soil metagenome]